MDDPDPFDLDSSKPRPAAVPRPAEKLWTVRREAVTWNCQLRYHGEWGVEAVILRNEKLFVSIMFEKLGDAIAWSDRERETRDVPSPK